MKFTVTCLLPATTELIVGATIAIGLPVTVFEATPGPDASRALIFIDEYVVPLVSPVIVIGVEVSAGLRVTHVVPFVVYHNSLVFQLRQ